MIVCCGIVSSGTRLVHRIVTQDLGLRAIHRSYPHWEKLWDWHEYPSDMRWVVIQRRPDVVIPAAIAAGHPGVRYGIRRDPPADVVEVTMWYEQGIRMMASIPGAYWISYEALVADPDTQIANLARHLGVETWIRRQDITDENAKWLEQPS